MVNPLLLIALPLGWAFLYPLIAKTGKWASGLLSVGVMVVMTASSAVSLVALLLGAAPVMIQTGGFAAPLTINLLLDTESAWLVTILGLAGAGTLAGQVFRTQFAWNTKQVILFFVLMLGAYGLVLTRDLFNVFVFLEISGIAVFGLLSTSRDGRVFEAGFKYMVAGGLSSTFFLLGVTILYLAGGTLNIDGMAAEAAKGSFQSPLSLLGLASLLVALLIEAKPVLANGWAMDAYEAADPGIAALMSGVAATAVVAVLAKILPLYNAIGPTIAVALMVLGLIGFVLGNLQALTQKSLRRTLGYSSSAQVGLIVALFGLLSTPLANVVGTLPIIFVLLMSHALAKSGLFWLADHVGDATGTKDSPTRSLRNRPVLLVLAAIFVLALIGLPPFPAFGAKWSLMVNLANQGLWLPMGLILVGSLLEAAYLLRWFTSVSRKDSDPGTVDGPLLPEDWQPDQSALDVAPVSANAVAAERESDPPSRANLLMAFVPALALVGGGLFLLGQMGVSLLVLLPVGVLGAIALLDVARLPVKVQVPVAIAGIGALAWWVLPGLDLLRQIFGLMFLAGSALQMVALMNRRGRQPGVVALVATLVAALTGLLVATTSLEFFVSWELMTLASFFLVLRGRRASAGALSFILFSLGGAFLILFGLTILPGLPSLSQAGAMLMQTRMGGPLGLVAGLALGLGLLIKAGGLGLHVWLPSTYAEADDDISPLLSSVLSKAGVLGLFLAAGFFAQPLLANLGYLPGVLGGSKLEAATLADILGWVGVATAVAGALLALFQEDIKYSLAYSSMSQLGYIVLSFAMMTHLGWVSSLYLSVTHLFIKGMIFLAAAGIIQRTGTRYMYQMGGLIKRMPISFVSVLIGIIALSGVPPLAGFGGKWLMYTALLEKGWYLQAGLAMFSSAVAFLYLFRLIHSMFLGQLKTRHREVKEASFWTLLPQVAFMLLIVGFSMFPTYLIQPLQAAVEPWFTSTVHWEGYTVISSLGYWNGNWVMYATMGVFLIPLAWLMLAKGRTYWVKQFNIVFAAERPYKPETTHYAYNFYGHYQKALGFLAKPFVRNFWTRVGSVVHTLSDGLRRWNTGNAQGYALQVFAYLILVYLVLKGGF